MRAAGGEVYAITSEPQSLAARAQEDWDLPFACVGDPHHEIRGTLEARGWLALHTMRSTDFVARNTSWEVSHPKSAFQPGVLALNNDSRVLYRWRSVPSRDNVGGASRRPTPAHVWASVQQAMALPTGAEDAAHDDDPVLDAAPAKFPLFATLLMANGWFLRPVPFVYQGDGQNPMARIPKMFRRLFVFLALWVLAFVLLPITWAGIALAVYLVIGARGIWSLYSTFEDQTRVTQAT